MPRRKRNLALIALLEDLMVLAQAGEIRALYTLYRFRDGTYVDDHVAADFDDLQLELRTKVLLMRDKHQPRGEPN